MHFNIFFRIKFLLARILGRFLSRYENQKKVLSVLNKNLLPSMSKNKHSKYKKSLLIMGTASEYVKVEALFFKLMESLGYEVNVCVQYSPYTKRIYSFFGVKNVFFPETFYQKKSLNSYKIAASEILIKCKDFNELTKFEINNIKIGEYAASSAMRITRASSIDLNDKKSSKVVTRCLLQSLRAAEMARDLLETVKPDIFLFNDKAYSPDGQIFDDALYNKKIEIISFNNTYDPGLFIFRRFNQKYMDTRIHPNSITSQDWLKAKEFEWNDLNWSKLHKEMEAQYITGDWYKQVGTQFNKRMQSKDELFSKFKLDRGKKIAILFSHMFWDASFSFGEILFDNYYDWFINVLEVAKNKTNINWIIKVHPANSTKNARDNFKGSHSEMDAIQEVFGNTIPDHIVVIEPESDINTFSLFSIMNYCLTVRGTIGIEAAAMGIPTLLAGTGRYDNKGFTYDFKTKNDYLNALNNLETISEMSSNMVRLAQIHMYYLFKRKCLKIDKVDIDYDRQIMANLKVTYNFSDFIEFSNSKFAKIFEEYIHSNKQDYLRSEN
jgi:hypothetical protein